jgi:hypothetical protein
VRFGTGKPGKSGRIGWGPGTFTPNPSPQGGEERKRGGVAREGGCPYNKQDQATAQDHESRPSGTGPRHGDPLARRSAVPGSLPRKPRGA